MLPLNQQNNGESLKYPRQQPISLWLFLPYKKSYTKLNPFSRRQPI